jgi:hypothetical protein
LSQVAKLSCLALRFIASLSMVAAKVWLRAFLRGSAAIREEAMPLTKTTWMLAQGVLLALAAGQGVVAADEALPTNNPHASFSIDADLPAEQSGGDFAFARVSTEPKNTARFTSSLDFDLFVFSGNLTAKPDVEEISLGANHREIRPAAAYLQAFENVPSKCSPIASPFGEGHWAYIFGGGLVGLSMIVLKRLRRVRGIEDEGIEHEALAA